jgi:hypothetical protein
MINNFNVKVNIIAINFFEEIEEEFSDNFLETDNQKETKNVLKKLIKMSPNVKVFTSNMANSIHKQFRKKRISPYVKYRGPLYFTENLFFDVNVFSKTVKSDIPSLKSFSLAAEYSKI